MMNWKSFLLASMICVLLATAACAAGWRLPAACSGGCCPAAATIEISVSAEVAKSAPPAAAEGTCCESARRPIRSVTHAAIRGPAKAIAALHRLKPVRRAAAFLKEAKPVRRLGKAIVARRR